jgi:hypothetical protein
LRETPPPPIRSFSCHSERVEEGKRGEREERRRADRRVRSGERDGRETTEKEEEASRDGEK